jgi:cytochrome c-type biogenesis protein CcmF
LFTASVVLIASAIIVFVGTSAPMFGQSVDTFFYNEMHLPIAIIIGLLNGLSLLIKWRHTDKQDIIKKSLPSVVIAFVFTLVLVLFGGVDDIMLILLAFSMTFALVVNVEIAIKIIKGNKKMLGAYVAHIGIAVFVLGVIGSAAYSKQVDVDLIKNQTTTAFGYEMTFTGWDPIDNNTKYSFNIDVKKGGSEYQVKPVMYVSEFNNSLMRIPAILNLPTQDFYVSPNGYDEGKSNANHNSNITSLKKGDSTEFNGTQITFTAFNLGAETMTAMQEGRDFQMGANLILEKNGKEEEFELLRKSVGGKIEFTSFTSEENDIKIGLVNLSADVIEISVSTLSDDGHDHSSQSNQEILSVSASIKPFISFVWIGVAVMVFGFFISMTRRLQESMKKQG